MPRILESEALALAQNIDSLDDTQKPQALDILTRYKQQQDDFGEPEWPTYAREREDSERRYRSMFEDLKNVDKAAPSLVDTLQYSDNPDADRARVASIAYLSRVYGKPADEIGRSPDLYRNDYTTRRGQKSTDDLGFYKLASAEVAAMQRKENAFLEGSRAALRGENVISSLQGWQGKNLDMMEDSSQFTQGFLRAQEKAGDMIPLADKMLKLIESGTGKSNSTRVFDAEAAKELDDMTAELATMKPRERKEVYASIAARVEAAGYEQKGFWSQMLGQIDQGLFRMSQTVPQGMGSVLGTIGEFVGGSDVASDREDRDRRSKERGEETTAEMKLRQEKLGEVQSEVAQIISGTVDPVKTTVGWIPDYLEAGAIKGPGAVLPFMTASAALGPYGAGLVFTADFAEQNRRDLVAAGLDRDDAARIGMMAAPLQAAVESLSNAFQLGKWASPIAPGSSFLKRYVTNSIASGATEFTEEQVQENIIRPIVQDVVGMIDANVPQIGFGEMWGKMKSDTPELISVLAPMALVFGGVMTNADLQLSRDLTGNVDGLTAVGYSQAQATTVIQEKDEAGRIAKARELWGVRAGTKESMQSGAAKLSEKLRLLQSDASTAQAELERRGMLPRMLHAEEGNWRLTFNDGSVADFQTHNEANAARWSWAQDQLGEFHAITRETLASLEKNLDVGREIAVEFKPDARTAADAVKDGASHEMIGRRVGQGKALGDVDAGTTYDEAMATDKAASIGDEFLSSLQILGSSKTEFLDGIMRTTIKLWEGSNVLTLVEEKLEGDAKAMMRTPQGRDWLLSRLRNYEQASGDKVFRDVADDQLQNDDIVEAWSHVGQSYLVGRSTFGEPLQGKAMRRFGRFLMRAGLGGAFNSESAFFAAVAGRAQKLMEAKKAGTLPADFTEELERQLGIDSQVKHDAGALQEAASIIDTSGYSEETPGPNGETFSMGYLGNVQDSGNVQLKAVDLARGTHESEGLDQGSEGQGTFRYRKDNKTLYWHLPPGELRKESAIAALERKGFKVDRSIVMTFGSEHSYLAHGLAREVATTFSLSRATPADASKVVQMPDGARLVGPTTFSIRAYHGTPHKVAKFSLDKIGTGEGAQAYGWGLYFAEARDVAKQYQDSLAHRGAIDLEHEGRKRGLVLSSDTRVELIRQANNTKKDDLSAARALQYANVEARAMDINALAEIIAARRASVQGNLYTVELLPDADEFLDWDRPLSEQSEKVKAALADVGESPGDIQRAIDFLTPKISMEGRQAGLAQKQIDQLKVRLGNVNLSSGAQFYNRLGEAPAASAILAKAGIPGIKYLDGGSRGAGDGTRNYVIFDENLVRILEENGQPVANETFSLRVTPAQDAEYMAAVEAGDMETAQRMVDEAARAAGYNSETLFRGRQDTGNVVSFGKDGAHFTPDREYAEGYAEGEFGNVVSGKAKIIKPLRIDLALIESDSFDTFKAHLSNQGLLPSTPARLFEWSQNPKYNQTKTIGEAIDAIESDSNWADFQEDPSSSFTDNLGSAIWPLGFDAIRTLEHGNRELPVVILKSPSQIKSADPVTSDADGNVIPLSQRFNPERNEITFSLRLATRRSFLKGLASSILLSHQANAGESLNEAMKGVGTNLSPEEEVKFQAWKAKYAPMDSGSDYDLRGAFKEGITPDGERGHFPDTYKLPNHPTFSKESKYSTPEHPGGEWGERNGHTTFTPSPWMAGDADRMEELKKYFKEVEPDAELIMPDAGSTFSLRSGDFEARAAAMFSPFQRTPELRMAIARVAKERVFKVIPQLLELRGELNANAKERADIEIRFSEEMAMLRTDFEADEKQVRDERDFELKAVSQDKGSELDRERLRRTADKKLARLRLDYERTAAEAEKRKASELSKFDKKDNRAQRDRIKQLLRVHDALLSAIPAEVRPQVGGYVRIAELNTDEKAIAFLEDRVQKMEKVLEKWLKKEAVKQIERVLQKGMPDMKAGKKGKGKDADMHALFAAASTAKNLDALAVAGRLADLDARILSGDLTPEQEALAMTERGLVELVGDLKNADSGRAWAALDTLNDIYRGGWLKWKLAEIERKERRAGLRQDFITATGKTGVRDERTAADKQALTLLGRLQSSALSLSSMHEVLSYAFGLDNPNVNELVDAERSASNTYEDANQRMADEIEALFTEMAGGVVAGERLRWQMAQRTIKPSKGGELSQLEAMQALLMWRQEDGRRHMEGTRNENNEVTSSWSYDQAWIDEVTAAMTPEARRVMSFIMEKYGAEWATLNPLYRARYSVNMPHHDNYAPLTVTPMQSKDGSVVDPVTGAAVASGSILTPGSLRTRSQSAVAEPEFRDALQTLVLHSRQMEYWKAYYDLSVEMSAILGNREVMNAVHAKGGKEAGNALRQWVDAIAQGGFRDASLRLELMRAASRMQGRAAGVALLGRMSAILSQSTQLAAASVQIPVTSYLTRLAKLMTGGLGWGDALRSSFIQRRFKTAPPIVRQAMDSLASAKPNAIQGLSSFFGNVLSGADAFFTSGTYAILLDYHREQGVNMRLAGAELEAYATQEAERMTEQVAQPTRMTARSLAELTNTSPLGKVGWAFASEARQKVALAFWAAANAKADPMRAAKAAFLTFVVGGLFTQVLKNLLREAKGDDDREMWSLNRLGYAMTISPIASAIPFGSAIMGDANMLSNVQRTVQTLGNDEVDFRDVDSILSAAGLFNDTAASLSQLTHLGLDLSRIAKNAAD